MSKGKIVFTDGTYTFAETGVKNEFYFYRNDRNVLGKMGKNEVMCFFSQYLLKKVEEGEIQDLYAGEINFEISTDGKCIKMTAVGKPARRPNLRIVKTAEGEELPDATEEQPKPNFFPRWFGKESGE